LPGWACCPNSEAPLGPEGQVFCMVKDSEIIRADTAEKIKSQSAAHLKLSVTQIQLQKHKTQG